MAKIKNSLVIVILNEERSIYALLDSILTQTVKPDEMVFIDGYSRDKTVQMLKKHRVFEVLNVKLIRRKGNIAKGRNKGIREAKGEIIAFTDAGCVLDKKWFENIIKPFDNKNLEVVAGYYKGRTSSVFQKCLVPYVLVMPDKVNSQNFLPATRSMAIRKRVFEKVGTFREDLDHAEDFEFARRIKKNGVNIKFAKNAIVGWIPRDNIFAAFKMFYNYAKGDIVAGIIRSKVWLIFARYLFVAMTVFLVSMVVPGFTLFLLAIFFILYIYWSVLKNFKYVKEIGAILYLPLLQFTSDIAVMSGAIMGIINVIHKK